MDEQNLPAGEPSFRRRFHPEQLDLDQFAAAIRQLLTPEIIGSSDLPSEARRVMNVVSKPN